VLPREIARVQGRGDARIMFGTAELAEVAARADGDAVFDVLVGARGLEPECAVTTLTSLVVKISG